MTARFLLDSMLGRLARWLRIAGYDVEYFPDADDDFLIERSHSTGRILVTKDRALARRALKNDVSVILLEERSLEDQLARILREFGPADGTRCPLCNSDLRVVTGEERFSLVDRGIIPKEIAERYEELWVCDRCGKGYWEGKHWEHISDVFEKARRKAGI